MNNYWSQTYEKHPTLLQEIPDNDEPMPDQEISEPITEDPSDNKAFCTQMCKERHADREQACEEVCNSCIIGLEDDINAFTTCMGLKGFTGEDFEEEGADDIETEPTGPPPEGGPAEDDGPEGEP